MDVLAVVLGGAVGLAVGAGIGVFLGRWSARHSVWLFWLIALGLVLAGTAIAAVGLQVGLDAVFAGGVGLMCGGLTTLKYASHRIPGMGGQA